MQVKVEKNRRETDTYRCSHCEYTERGHEHPDVKDGSAPVGYELQLVGVVTVVHEREDEHGKVSVESETMVTDASFGERGVQVRIPGDADVVYLMDDRRNTTKVLRPKAEWEQR